MNEIDKLSDAELEKIANQESAASMSDEQLSSIANQSAQQPKKGIWGATMEALSRPGSAVRAPFFGKSPVEGFKQPETIPSFKQAGEKKYWDLVGEQSKGMDRLGGQVHPYMMMPGGMVTSAAGLGLDVATDPMTYVGGAAIKGLMKTPMGAALGRFATKTPKQIGSQIGGKLRSTIHGEQWIDDVAMKTREVAQGMEKAIGGAYDEAYTPFKDAPINSQNIVKIFTENNIPEPLVKEVYLTLGDINTVGKAHAANQIIRQKISEQIWQGNTSGMGGILNPKIAARNVYRGLKGEIRAGIGAVDKNAEVALRGLDDLASSDKTDDGIYDRVHDLFDMVGRRGRVETSGAATLFKSGLGGTSKRKIIGETPKMATQLDKYIKSSNFKKDLGDTVKKALDLKKELKSFRTREGQKTIVKGTAAIGGIGTVMALITRLFGGK